MMSLAHKILNNSLPAKSQGSFKYSSPGLLKLWFIDFDSLWFTDHFALTLFTPACSLLKILHNYMYTLIIKYK